MSSESDEEVVRIGAPSSPPEHFTSTQLKQIDSLLFVGEQETLWRPADARGVYGGQIVGQALSAALKTVPPEKHVHSLHSYFLMKGDSKKDIVYHVKLLRDGKSFAARLVSAVQQGNTIFVLIASFQVPHPKEQPVVQHQWKMPQVPSADQLLTSEQYSELILNDPRCPKSWKAFFRKRTKSNSPIDIRPVYVSDVLAKFGPIPPGYPQYPMISSVPKQATWMKCKQRLPDDPTVHAAVLAYASDMGLLGTAKHDVSMMDMAVIASLDHVMWFHAPFRADEWLLYVMESPRASDGRGLAYGGVFTTDGTLCVMVGQEGVLRVKSPL